MNSNHVLCLVLASALFAASAEPGSTQPPAAPAPTEAPAKAEKAETIVPPQSQVSEAEARRELANVLQRMRGPKVSPQVSEAELRKRLERRPNDPVLLANLADIEASRGHFARSRELYERALANSEKAPQIRLRYARQALAWGDFYLSERLLRAHLRQHPDDLNAALDLAGVLIAERRFEAAEGQYRALAKRPAARQKALIGMANGRLLEKDYQAVLPFTDAVLQTRPDQVEALKLRGEALRLLHRYDEATAVFRRLTKLPEGRRDGWIGLGRVARAQNDEASAREYFRRAAALNPKDITARYLAAGERAAEADQEMITRRDLTVADLNTLAGLYASDGRLDSAIAAYQAALAKDPENFSARIGLAEVLAGVHRYDESIRLLTELHNEFPGDARVTLSLARVLSWSRRFNESIKTYRELNALNPEDTATLTEMARVASWANQMKRARDAYARIYTPSVDSQLIEALRRSPQNQELVGTLEGVPDETKPPYEKYERLRQLLDSGELPPASRPSVEAALSDLESVYRLQKSAWLESRAKWLAWNRRFLQSENTYQELVAFKPGNEEAWSSLAEVQAIQDLTRKSKATYHQLLQLDPLNQIAGLALELERIREDPGIFAHYNYWDEKGIGRGSDLSRQHIQAGSQFIWNAQTRIRVAGDWWYEEPGTGPHAYAAGTTIGIRTVFNEFWRASGEWSHKEYYSSQTGPTDTGHADLTFNAWDYVRLTLQYARLDEIHNEFGLEQGVQSDNVSLLFDSDLNHNVGVSGGATWTHFTDNNDSVWVTVAPTFTLLDEPHRLQLVVRGDYRDTKDNSIFVFVGPQLVNIIHPYWTPQEYFRGTAILEWRQDISPTLFAGAEQHYLALRAGGGIDSTGNKNYILEAEWHYDFLKHWSLEARGMVDRSSAWNGAAAFVDVIFRF